MRAFLPGLIILGALVAPPALAKTMRVKSRRAAVDFPTIEKLTALGEVALVESNPDGSARQVVLFDVMNAPPERVFDAVMDVASYPKYLKTVVEVNVVRKAKGITTYDWELDMPFFNLRGRRAQRGKRPFVVDSRGVSGNLRGTRERWEFYPVDGGKRTLVLFYRAIDVETGGVLLKTMVSLEPSMEQGANLATAFVHLRGLRQHIESLPPVEQQTRVGAVPPFRHVALGKNGVDVTKLERLLKYGQLALIESHADGSLKQVALLTVVAAAPTKMAKVVQEPAKYPEFIPNFAEQNVSKTKDGKLALDWELEVPLKNLEGTSLMTIEEDGSVDVVATGGDITRGRWRWEFNPFGKGETIPVHYTYTDLRESSFVTKMIVDRQPLFEHGMVIASGAVAMHAMKARAEGLR